MSKKKSNNISEMMQEVIQFRDDRKWSSHHNPKNLAMALVRESSEALEHLIWPTCEEVKKNKDLVAEIGDELGDVMHCLLLLSNSLKLNPAECFWSKIEKAKKKYPIKKCLEGKYKVDKSKGIECSVKALIQRGDKYLIIKEELSNGLIVTDLPGGHPDYGENPYNALKRETKEEIGLNIEIRKPLGVYWFHRSSNKAHVLCSLFLCKVVGKDEIDLSNNPDINENIFESLWLTKKQLVVEARKMAKQIENDSLLNIVKSL